MTATANALLDAALAYAARGWRVHPLVPRDKMPLAGIGITKATTDATQIRTWWAEHPQANVGIATGAASGLTVVDVDASDGKPGLINLTRLCARHGGVPQTLAVETSSGGRHLYFQHAPALHTGNDRLGEAIDVKNDGGNIVAPPSVHPSGHVYTFIDPAAEVLASPEWMVPQVQVRPRAARHQPAMTLEEATQALAHVDPDDRDAWLNMGVVLGRTFDCSAEAWKVYEAWCARSEKFNDDRAGNLTRMRERFYEASQEQPRAGQEQLGIGTLVMLAQEGGWVSRDADHWRLSQGLIAAIREETGERPVFAMGDLWRVKDALWLPWSMEDLTLQVGQRFGGGRLCRRGGDFAQVARLASTEAHQENYFADAPVGIAAPSGFWRVTDAGEVVREALTAGHRQRMRLAADPVLDGRPERLLAMLAEAFDGHDPEGQTRLLQQLTGCALTRSLWRHRIVALLYGATSSGKSTFLNVLRAAFPRDALSSTPPSRWGHEYHVAALAGKALNIVGELEDADPIPGGAFKQITGRDMVSGRHPTHRPFSFVCEAAHFFNCNRPPPTSDRDDAFFRRWRVLHFANVVPEERKQLDLDDSIIKGEFGAFLGWALAGAADVARAGGIIETAPHRRALARWRVGNNSALEFLLDPEACVIEAGASAPGQAAFVAYQGWATGAGLRRSFGRNGFYEAVERGGAVAGVRLVRRDHQTFIDGLRLRQVGF